MKTLLGLLAVTLLTGCAYDNLRIGDIRFRSLRLAWVSGPMQAKLPTTNGMAEVKLMSSGSDKETAQVLTQTLIEGLQAYLSGGASMVMKGAIVPQTVYVTNYVYQPTLDRSVLQNAAQFSPVPPPSKGTNQP